RPRPIIARDDGSPPEAAQPMPSPRKSRSGAGGGAARSTVQVALAGDGSTLPAPSTARTRRVCSPSARFSKVMGLVHGTPPAPSRLHSYVTPVSVEPKVNVALVLSVVPGGPETMVVSGAAVSTVMRTVLDGGLVLPAAFVVVATME